MVFSGTFGEILVTLPLFNRMDREAANQKRFYIINWPLKNGQEEAKTSGQSEADGGESAQTIAFPGSTTNNPNTQIGSNDGEQPPDQEQIVHIHTFEGPCCHAPECNGGRCQCNECLDESDVVVRAKRPSEPTEGQIRKIPRVESASRSMSINIIHWIARRELAGKIFQNKLIECLHGRLELAAPVPPVKIQAVGMSACHPDLHPDGYIITFEIMSSQDLINAGVEVKITLCAVDSSDSEQTRSVSQWNFWGTNGYFILTDGRIIVTKHKSYIIITKDNDNHWLTEAIETPIPFLCTFSMYHNERQHIPIQIFDLISGWDEQYIKKLFKTNTLYIHSFIDTKGGLVIFSILNNTLLRWHLKNYLWVSEIVYEAPSDPEDPSRSGSALERHLSRVILLDDGSALLVIKRDEHFDYFQVWTEGEPQRVEITADKDSELLHLPGDRLVAYNGFTLIFWEHTAGKWIERVLLTSKYQDEAFYITPLRDGRLVILEDHSVLKVYIDLNGQWSSTRLYCLSGITQTGKVVELRDGRIVGVCFNSILIWDLYQSAEKDHQEDKIP